MKKLLVSALLVAVVGLLSGCVVGGSPKASANFAALQKNLEKEVAKPPIPFPNTKKLIFLDSIEVGQDKGKAITVWLGRYDASNGSKIPQIIKDADWKLAPNEFLLELQDKAYFGNKLSTSQGVLTIFLIPDPEKVPK